MENENYRQILILQMRPTATPLHGNDFIFQHDKDLKHTGNVVKNYLQKIRIEVLLGHLKS